LGKRKALVVEYVCHCDGLPCCNFDLALGHGVCEVDGDVCYRFTVRNFDKVTVVF